MLQNSVLLKSTSSPLSIKIKPKSLDFIGEGDGATLKQILSIYNPNDVAIKFEISLSVRNVYTVVPDAATISSKKQLDILFEIKEPIKEPYLQDKIKLAVAAVDESLPPRQVIIKANRRLNNTISKLESSEFDLSSLSDPNLASSERKDPLSPSTPHADSNTKGSQSQGTNDSDAWSLFTILPFLFGLLIISILQWIAAKQFIGSDLLVSPWLCYLIGCIVMHIQKQRPFKKFITGQNNA
jgi:TM2 domain-containing membrane protein YozV